MRKLARQTGIARESDWLIAKKDLNRYVLKQEQLLTDESKQVQLERCRKLLKKAETADWDRILFFDEMLFSLEQPYYNRMLGFAQKVTTQVFHGSTSSKYQTYHIVGRNLCKRPHSLTCVTIVGLLCN